MVWEELVSQVNNEYVERATKMGFSLFHIDLFTRSLAGEGCSLTPEVATWQR